MEIFLILLAAYFSLQQSVYAAEDAISLVPPKILSSEEYYNEAQKIDFKSHTLSAQEFLKIKDDDNVTVLDLRSPEEYKAGHIEGAILFGPDITEKKLANLAPKKDQIIITYCTQTIVPTRMVALTTVALPQFVVHGYENAKQLEVLWHSRSGSAQIKIPCATGDDPYLADKRPLVFSNMGECVADDGKIE